MRRKEADTSLHGPSLCAGQHRTQAWRWWLPRGRRSQTPAAGLSMVV